MFVEFVIQNQLFSYSLEDFAQILDIPCEGACAFTDQWSLDELAYGVPSDGPYQTNPSTPNDIISSIRIDREGQVRRIHHEEEINVQEYQVPTREIEPTLKPMEEIIQENVFCLGESAYTTVSMSVPCGYHNPKCVVPLMYRKIRLTASRFFFSVILIVSSSSKSSSTKGDVLEGGGVSSNVTLRKDYAKNRQKSVKTGNIGHKIGSIHQKLDQRAFFYNNQANEAKCQKIESSRVILAIYPKSISKE
uniref:Pentatricopeptide repeat-containing protein n=1 Tax=Tanacetum cinerariifolium TaxID=118510 RepID=A0A6L2J5U5_TANCI|nr:pentatricopeptide repeat-containing protein [Tanacetum cinerariifolium]